MSVILDDFYTRGSCDSNFIKDINSKMRVPDRISLDPSSLPQVNLSLNSSENDNMKVPERIVMSGAQNQSSPLMAFNRRGDDLIDNLDPVPLQHALDPLPTSLVLNEVNYPDLERLTIEKREIETAVSTPLLLTNESQNHIPTVQQPSPLALSNISNVISHSSTSIPSSSSTSSSSMNQTNNTQSILVDTRRIKLLENRIHEIEVELSKRQLMDKLLYITFGSYFVLKFLRLLFS